MLLDQEPLRVFVGYTQPLAIPYRVLVSSLLRHTKTPITLTPIQLYPLGGWRVPELCNWQGRAIYLDPTLILFADIKDLWDKTLDIDVSVWMTRKKVRNSVYNWQPSLMVLNCALAQRHNWEGWQQAHTDNWLISNPEKLAAMRTALDMTPPPGILPNAWNSADKVVLGSWRVNQQGPAVTKILRYAKPRSQPWLEPDHPLANLWQTELQLAIKLGYVTLDEFEQALRAWVSGANYDKQQGLHPYYQKYLPIFEQLNQGRP